ncbi:MAG: hypothetical protein K1Y36_09675 [Blastocatellia bacterium]|nr:hypothetical protein [Blastocatellia bacterium]
MGLLQVSSDKSDKAMSDGRTDSAQISDPGWIGTTRGKIELGVVLGFCLLNLITPVIYWDLYPFSIAPMFMISPQKYCAYIVLAPDGTQLPPIAFGVHRNYWGNPVHVGIGIRPVSTIDEFGQVADEPVVRQQVERFLRQYPEIPFVVIEQQVFGPVDANRVGITQIRRWKIMNPVSAHYGK